MADQPELASMLNGMNVDDLLALQSVLETRLEEARQQVKVQAESLGMKCALDNGTHRKKAKRNPKHDDA